MTTLAEFLAARLDDDEAAAKAAIAEEPEGACGCPPGDWSYRDSVGSRDDYGVLYHEMRHDPARVLRQVHAGRMILDGYAASLEYPDSLRSGDTWANGCAEGDLSALKLAVARLAAVYAGHPDYDEAWRP